MRRLNRWSNLGIQIRERLLYLVVTCHISPTLSFSVCSFLVSSSNASRCSIHSGLSSSGNLRTPKHAPTETLNYSILVIVYHDRRRRGFLQNDFIIKPFGERGIRVVNIVNRRNLSITVDHLNRCVKNESRNHIAEPFNLRCRRSRWFERDCQNSKNHARSRCPRTWMPYIIC